MKGDGNTSSGTPPHPATAEAAIALNEFDRRLIAATQSGLPLVAQPYEAVGAMLGVSGEAVRERFAELLAGGVVRRIGAVPNHYRLGYVANGMTVWDVDDARVDALGERVGALPGVSHCYRRPRELPRWPYNLFAMLHGRSRAEVERQRDAIRALLGDACRADDVLYSTAILKKTGLRLTED
jgi:DNA-binding Lrp family transcriptional regulator